ncbi:MAG: hypothetical protein WC304_01090 [Candidatus Gracilibacteria bacterium]|jgi:hypothetical protein
MENSSLFVTFNLFAIFPGVLILGFIFYFLYRFSMNTSPFATMKAIYVYIAALIGLLLVAAGVYGILDHVITVLFTDAAIDAIYFITPLTQIIVGMFVMIPHWGIGHHFHLLEHHAKNGNAKRK